MAKKFTIYCPMIKIRFINICELCSPPPPPPPAPPAIQPSRPSNQPTTQLGRQSASHPGIQLRFNPIIPFVVPFVNVVLFLLLPWFCSFFVVMVYFRYDVNIIRPTTTTHSHSPQTPPIQSSPVIHPGKGFALWPPLMSERVFANREIKCMRFRLYFKYCFAVLFFFFLCSNSVSNELNFKYDQWNFNILSRNLLFFWEEGRRYGPSLSFRAVSRELNSITLNS